MLKNLLTLHPCNQPSHRKMENWLDRLWHQEVSTPPSQRSKVKARVSMIGWDNPLPRYFVMCGNQRTSIESQPMMLIVQVVHWECKKTLCFAVLLLYEFSSSRKRSGFGIHSGTSTGQQKITHSISHQPLNTNTNYSTALLVATNSIFRLSFHWHIKLFFDTSIALATSIHHSFSR